MSLPAARRRCDRGLVVCGTVLWALRAGDLVNALAELGCLSAELGAHALVLTAQVFLRLGAIDAAVETMNMRLGFAHVGSCAGTGRRRPAPSARDADDRAARARATTSRRRRSTRTAMPVQRPPTACSAARPDPDGSARCCAARARCPRGTSRSPVPDRSTCGRSRRFCAGSSPSACSSCSPTIGGARRGCHRPAHTRRARGSTGRPRPTSCARRSSERRRHLSSCRRARGRRRPGPWRGGPACMGILTRMRGGSGQHPGRGTPKKLP